jgi:hypothetical protein
MTFLCQVLRRPSHRLILGFCFWDQVSDNLSSGPPATQDELSCQVTSSHSCVEYLDFTVPDTINKGGKPLFIFSSLLKN